MSRSALAQRLAELVDSDEALGATVAHIEHMRQAGKGGQIRWHLDDAGVVQIVDVAGTLYRRRGKRSKITP